VINKRVFKQAILSLLLINTTGALANAVNEIPDDMYNVEVDAALVNAIENALPESMDVDQAFLNPDFTPVLPLSEDAHLSVTFIDEGAGYRNSLGWISWGDNTFDNLLKSDIDTNNSGVISFDEITAVEGITANWIFPNSSEAGGGGSLVTGDTVVINEGGLFSAGTNVSFFLGANTWSGGDIVGEISGVGEKNMFYGLDFLNPEADASSYYGSGGLNDNSRHVAMLFADSEADQVILGFEDLIRPWGDNDFNDAVFIVEADPVTALFGANIVTAPLPLPASGLFGVFFISLFAYMAGYKRPEEAATNAI
jgi:hypothetical protein